MDTKQTAPGALIFISPTCPHCPGVLQSLGELVKQGVIGQLEVVNIGVHPERAEALGVRSVPWIKVGDFELEGLHSLGELRDWASRSGTVEGLADYFSEQLKSGRLPQVIRQTATNNDALQALLLLSANPDTELNVRIGVSAVIEDLAGSDSLLQHWPALEALARNDDPRVRADACHFLALTENVRAVPLLEALQQDPERAVRDVADDSLEELTAALQQPGR